MLDAVAYWIHKSAFFAFQWMLLAPFCAAALYVVQYFGGREAPLALRAPLLVLLLGAIVGTHWLAACAAKKRVLEQKGFSESLYASWAEARMWLSWLPVVGRAFAGKQRRPPGP